MNKFLNLLYYIFMTPISFRKKKGTVSKTETLYKNNYDENNIFLGNKNQMSDAVWEELLKHYSIEIVEPTTKKLKKKPTTTAKIKKTTSKRKSKNAKQK